MQDRYVGDIGDYVKFGLLRVLSRGRRLGVAWYRFPDETGNSDGRHTGYLESPDRWRKNDPKLFDVLRRIVSDNRRTLNAIEESGILGPAFFSGALLASPLMSRAKRGVWRTQWFETVQTDLEGCDIVFADPDNGLYADEKFDPGDAKGWKRIPLSEARQLAEGRTAVIYHHNTRRKGGHALEISDWAQQLGAETLALRWRAYSARTFFVVRPEPWMRECLEHFARCWSPMAELHIADD